MAVFFITFIAALCIGILGGLTGMGGILLPPTLTEVLGLEIHVAMGTSLASFFPAALYGAYLNTRRGHMDWNATLPLSLSGLVFILLGTQWNARLDGKTLTILLATLIIAVGCMAFRPVRPRLETQNHISPTNRRIQLAVVGALVGIASGLTGAGGAVLTIPVMILMGYPPLTAICAGQAYCVFIAFSGTIGNAMHGAVDFHIALLCVVGGLIGTKIGTVAAHRFPAATLKKLVAAICVATGCFLLLRVALA